MWLTILGCAVGGLIAVKIGTEVVRFIVHRRREQRGGIGGAQDVVYYSLPLQAILVIIGLVALVMHGLTS